MYAAKAVVPLVLSVVATLIQLIVTDVFNTPELQTLLAGIVTATGVFVVPNTPRGTS